jgi:hypothetical protein
VRAGEKESKAESVAATTTYTCQLIALYLLAYALGGELAFDALRQLPEWMAKVGSVELTESAIAEANPGGVDAILIIDLLEIQAGVGGAGATDTPAGIAPEPTPEDWRKYR